MSTYIALFSPASAIRHVEAGKEIKISYSGLVEWELGAAVLINFLKFNRHLTSSLIEPHIGAIGSALSQASPSFYNEALVFIQIAANTVPNFMDNLLNNINAEKSSIGWRNGLAMRENNRLRNSRMKARQVVAFLVHHAIDREDDVGNLARQIRKEFPKASIPLAATIEKIQPDDIQ